MVDSFSSSIATGANDVRSHGGSFFSLGDCARGFDGSFCSARVYLQTPGGFNQEDYPSLSRAWFSDERLQSRDSCDCHGAS